MLSVDLSHSPTNQTDTTGASQGPSHLGNTTNWNSKSVEVYDSTGHGADGKELLDKWLASTLSAVVPERHVLDAGCGTGPDSIICAKSLQARSVLGIDINEEMIQKANAKLKELPPEITEKIQFIVGDATTTNWLIPSVRQQSLSYSQIWCLNTFQATSLSASVPALTPSLKQIPCTTSASSLKPLNLRQPF
ncbi:class I SAM-dependent methyltransferase [Endozoicomonas atrinae]|uniref:class I SAM-dependent methyltransferase n=1 Tax=Endozoicomonas atrinae TaxID=1333660 RepID=UPI003AFFBC9D